MVCDLCKDGEAVIQLTEIEGSGVRLLHLCEKCAAERGVETTLTAAKPQINNFLQTIHEQMAGAKGEAAQCSFCSATLADFRSTGRLGCAFLAQMQQSHPAPLDFSELDYRFAILAQIADHLYDDPFDFCGTQFSAVEQQNLIGSPGQRAAMGNDDHPDLEVIDDLAQ